MSLFIKKALAAIAAKQVFDKVMEKRQESRRKARFKLAPFALVGLGGVSAFLLYRSKQSD